MKEKQKSLNIKKIYSLIPGVILHTYKDDCQTLAVDLDLIRAVLFVREDITASGGVDKQTRTKPYST